jgi:DNA-binding NtrC family response regulator
MQTARILIVEDDSSLRTALFRAFGKVGYQVITATNRSEVEKYAGMGHSWDVAIIDLRLPDGDGIELMQEIRRRSPHCQAIILTGFGTIDSAIKATQVGAFHFLTKPFNMDEIIHLVEKALNKESSRSKEVPSRSQKSTIGHGNNIIGESPSIKKVLNLIDQVADSESNILITGESGTGKELVAKALHFGSSRSNRPFVPINCGAIPSELLESELFGHVKGAFTGAINNRIGRFEMAAGGTIFLDEIGDMSPSLQVKLLRVLQERHFEPVGSTKVIEADVRVVAATHRDLEAAVAEGSFREDLFYRLNVIPIHIPPLRERKSDIPILTNFFIETFNKSKGKKISHLSPEAMQCLLDYPWPGNIRELENLMERLAILKGFGEIEMQDLPNRYSQSVTASLAPQSVEIPESGMDFNSAVDSYENELILRALEKTGWNRNQAALLLRLNRTTLVEKIKKKGLRPVEANA